MRDGVVRGFIDRYGREPEWVVRSPGRVNLIGDHTDYNDGFVLPIAIEQATWIAAAGRDDRVVEVDSDGVGSTTVDLDHLTPGHGWSDYIAGTLHEAPVPLAQGFDAHIRSDVPVGAGLSSSAAVELGIARIASLLSGGVWEPTAAALAAQRAENEFVGMPSGIMDQLVVALATAGHALLIDCRSLESTPTAMPDGATVVILDTGTRRRLVESAYRERRDSCMNAAKEMGVAALRDVTVSQVAAAALEPETRRRARHVVTENSRTLAAAAALAANDPATVGTLMNESHASLRDDFEVSSPALDAITDLARNHPGCFGARVTGGGFAGCAVALVDEGHVAAFVREVGQAYDQATGNTSALFVSKAAAGVSVIGEAAE